jgi:ribosomal protein S18 acetylase RimI-like enzyme
MPTAMPAPDLHLELFSPADAPLIEPWFQAPGLSLPCGPAAGDWARRMLQDPRILAYVAWSDGGPIGFLRLDMGPDRVAELTVVVAPERRRQGVGTELLARALAEGERRGLRHLSAVVSLDNGAARAFFEAARFEPHATSLTDSCRFVRRIARSSECEPLEIEL